MRIDITPSEAMYDEPIAIRVSGAPPSAVVAFEGSALDIFERRWISRVEFVANADGNVDIERQAPIAGSYSGVDPMGLIWSMSLADPANAAAAARGGFALDPLAPLVVDISASAEGGAQASVRLSRSKLASGVIRRPVRDLGLVGSLFSHPGGPRPGILVLGGSGGGLDEPLAALLASHGYTTLALAYFASPGLPPEMREIPLEYFKSAIDWMIAQGGATRAGQIAVVGMSRGAELALQLAATFPGWRQSWPLCRVRSGGGAPERGSSARALQPGPSVVNRFPSSFLVTSIPHRRSR